MAVIPADLPVRERTRTTNLPEKTFVNVHRRTKLI
jgi:hypothetical protein